jgi:hypothetical protein
MPASHFLNISKIFYNSFVNQYILFYYSFIKIYSKLLATSSIYGMDSTIIFLRDVNIYYSINLEERNYFFNILYN